MYFTAEYNETKEEDLVPVQFILMTEPDEEGNVTKLVLDKFAFEELLSTLNAENVSIRARTDDSQYPYKVIHKNHM